MFSRNNLCRHPGLHRRYHEMRPETREPDERLDALPRLGQPGSRFFDPVVSPMADAAFSILERSYPPLAGRPVGERGPGDPEVLARGVEMLARRYGAVDVGVARTAPHHWYSHAGRHAEGWGEPIEPDHPTAIVLVVAMDFHTIRMAPSAPVLAESSRQYVEAAKIAHVVAEYLALAGHEARAHVDGRYQVLCAPLAQDAGLGHVGRIGILMHRRYGPCVRLSVVTTTAELPLTTGDHRYMEDFCRICGKCADNCPSRSIAHGGPPVSRGFAHWSVDQESCYAFWRRTGTDCSVCIASCPFTKPDSAIHRLIRAAIRRNPLNRRLALLGDDLFYGRKLRLRPENPDLDELASRWKIPV
ncbi:MAG: 4Fe-4S dicluster domain-containing protein [Acidobacteria bacterium]|nr:4Fe-4S dicluster domain-containing protein [Acidobacteriota bacterium]